MIKKLLVSSIISSVQLVALSALIVTANAQPSFSKYNTKTNFKDNKREPNQTTSVNTLINDSTFSRKDTFGRSKQGTGRKKSDTYVNLNPETAFGPEVITSFDFPKTSITDLTKHMQKLTGINLILDKDVKGTVSIMAPSPITVGDAWKAYLTALNMNGYTLVKNGAFYKIVRSSNIRYTPTKIYTGSYTPDTENYVMRVIPLKNISSSEISRSFRPFMSRYGRVMDIKQTNTVIIQDTGANINRLVRLIKFIDVPGHEESLLIIPVKNSSAQEIAKLLDQILSTRSSSKFRSSSKKKEGANIGRVIAEPRTNSIIAMANAAGAKQLRGLINKLDVKLVSSSGGRIHVYYLNHGDAETLSKTLSSLVSNSSRKTSRFTKANSEKSLFNSEVKITADKANNAIVVTASPTDYLTIKNVISKLDIARDQVYVEGMIMETNISKAKGFGISILGAYGSGGAQKAGFTGGSNDLVGLLQGNITSLGGLFIGGGTGGKVVQDLGNGKTATINSVNGLITAIATDSNTNVLATPQILVLDNTEGVFEVGETVPTPEKTNSANGSSTVSVKEQKIAMTLKITPQINKVTRYIKLKIDQKIEDFSQRKLPEGLASQGVATTTRSVVTTVNARDKDTVAMGGLMRDREVDSESKVPLLGDIPVLGWLFKQTTKNVTKLNLLFFLTPKIMTSYEKTVAATVKDVLNRRSAHLKDVIGEDDPFGTTVKGLYEKAKKQEEGPLYDKDDLFDKGGTIPNRNDIHGTDALVNPNYKEIMQKVEQKSSGVKKGN